MFGLFKKNKIKSESHKRAVGYWKNLTIQGIKEDFRPCHFCNQPIPRLQGHLFSNMHILNNKKYMEMEITKLEKRGIPSEEAQEIVWQKVESVYDDWLVCEKCVEQYFI